MLELSDSAIVVYEGSSLKVKETIQYTDVASLTITSGSDGFIIVRMPVDGPHAKVTE